MTPGKWLLGLLAACFVITGAVFKSSQEQAPPNAKETPLSLFKLAAKTDYVGDQACAACHSTETEDFHTSGHAMFVADPSLPLDKQGCESCHGPGKQHVDNEGGHIIAYGKIKSDDVDAACMRCHQDVMTSSQWHRESHARAGVSCVACHQIHPSEKLPGSVDPKDKGLLNKQIFPAAKYTGKLLKNDEATLCGSCHQPEVAKFRYTSHHPVPEGRLVCSDCHQLHPSASTPKAIYLGKDNCVSCHADVAGPFVYEHDPVAGGIGNGCLECHNPHGSHNPKLLNSFSRGLCAQCHTDKLANHFPGHSCWDAGCHVALHGSNTDPHFLTK